MHKPIVSIIVAIDEKRGIGKHNDLLFRIPEDHLRVRTVTREHPLVMGRKTFASLGRLLPKRTHIVITRDPQSLQELSYQPHYIVSTLEEGISIAQESETERLSSPIQSGIQDRDSRSSSLSDETQPSERSEEHTS